MLDKELFESITDDQGKIRPALRITVPMRVLSRIGLVSGESRGREETLQNTQIPIRAMREVREWCSYTADFGTVEDGAQFPPPVQLVTIPCRSPTGDGHCSRTGEARPCTLFGIFSSVDTP
ncbi:MAG: hypothetical protein HQM00_10250, partial [Magnetococcales bacterium]|nr:hypothetical protein [Magnetococcales bacterium]